MVRKLLRFIRRALLLSVIAAGGAAAIVCSAGPVFPQTNEAGVSSCGDCGWGAPAEVPGSRESARDRSASAPGGSGGATPAAEGAAEQDPDDQGVPIHDPTGDALDAFYQALANVEQDSEEPSIARIAFFGDSHTAGDITTGHLRRRLQERFGDGGHGFIAAGRPWRYYRHWDIENGETGRWNAYRIRHRRGGVTEGADEQLGLAGLAVETDRTGSSVWVKTSTRGPVGHTASNFELFYLAQPRGGRMEVSLDGAAVARLSTRAPEATPVYYLFRTEDGPHEVRVQARGRGLVRLFGVVVVREGPGVVLDTLGINGARVMTMLAWDQELLAEHVAQRSPDLVVMWYGTNEVGDDWYTIEQYEQWVIDALSALRRAAPGASCLFVGPPDMGRISLSDEAETLATPMRLLQIMAAQRDAADLVGCAHFSTFDAMGGRDAIAAWADATPPLAGRDGIHLTRPGYESLGDALYGALIDGYEQYLDRNPE